MRRADNDGSGHPTVSIGTRSAGRLDAHARRRIGHGLRLHYAALIAQPLPERFTALLADLAAGAKPEEPSR